MIHENNFSVILRVIRGRKKVTATFKIGILNKWNLDQERQYQASENALKVQISQLETTLKSDLNDKRRLADTLAQERENYAQLDSDFQVWDPSIKGNY